jgi:Cu2+-exporting ATPase
MAALSGLALAGPGRAVLARGAAAAAGGRPDMDTLVGLGAAATYAVSTVAAALPRLGWPTYFEEPAMLLGAVLAGRALEALLEPALARLAVDVVLGRQSPHRQTVAELVA